MDTITLSYQDQPAALAAPTRVWLAAHIEALPTGHPRKRFVAFMAFYARDILTGKILGPYSDKDAERFARLMLIDPAVIAADPRANDEQLAQLLQVPVEQLQEHRVDVAAMNVQQTSKRVCAHCSTRRRRRPVTTM
jgi:hypothetical protein